MRLGADYRAAVRTGRRVGRASLVLHLVAAGDSARPALVGFVVSRAVGSAVTRNRVKRRLREAVGARVGQLPPGVLLVVRANPAAATTPWAALCRDLDVALSRALPRSVEPSVVGQGIVDRAGSGTAPPARHPSEGAEGSG